MKYPNAYQRFNQTLTALTFSVIAVPFISTAFAAQSISTMSDEERTDMGKSEEASQQIIRAKQNPNEIRYSEREQAAIDLAIAKVNEQTPVTADSISHLKVRAINWSDSSMGCGKPGVEYLQRVIPGYLVAFNANEQLFTVHIGNGTAIICNRLQDIIAEKQKRGLAMNRLHKAAKVDLAEKLKVKPEEITVTKIRRENWTDSSLGCPVEGMEYVQGPIEGVRIQMTCRDKEYEYRAALDGTEFISCEKIISCHPTE